MADDAKAHPEIRHGARSLPAVTVDSYNVELRDEAGGFVGDRASFRAFRRLLEDWRDRLREVGDAYRAVLGRHFPAMAAVEVRALVEVRAKVEIQAIAVLPA